MICTYIYIYIIYKYTKFNVHTPIVYTCIFPAKFPNKLTWHYLLPMKSKRSFYPGCLGYIGDDKLPSFWDDNTANIRIPMKQSVFMECHKAWNQRCGKSLSAIHWTDPGKTWVSNSSIATYLRVRGQGPMKSFWSLWEADLPLSLLSMFYSQFVTAIATPKKWLSGAMIKQD